MGEGSFMGNEGRIGQLWQLLEEKGRWGNGIRSRCSLWTFVVRTETHTAREGRDRYRWWHCFSGKWDLSGLKHLQQKQWSGSGGKQIISSRKVREKGLTKREWLGLKVGLDLAQLRNRTMNVSEAWWERGGMTFIPQAAPRVSPQL